MNLYLIISLVIGLVYFYLTNYGSKINNNQLFYGGFIAIIASIVASLYFGFASRTEERTNYPGWLQTTLDAAVPSTADLWTATSTGSNKKPSYLGPSSTNNVETSQKDLVAAWIESKVDTGTPSSFTSQRDDAITSILVRDAKGDDRELPIMDFFQKIHEDMVLGYLRAQDYTIEKVAESTVAAASSLLVVKEDLKALIQTEQQDRVAADTANRAAVDVKLARKIEKDANLYVRFLGHGSMDVDWMKQVKANGPEPGTMIQLRPG
jgi:hypothetical protein